MTSQNIPIFRFEQTFLNKVRSSDRTRIRMRLNPVDSDLAVTMKDLDPKSNLKSEPYEKTRVQLR